jgi:hypothetical protein
MISIGNHELSPVSVFPNPVRSHLTVEFGSQKLSQNKAKVIDSAGRVRKELHLTGGSQTIPVNDLVPGLYFLSVETGETLKFVVE